MMQTREWNTACKVYIGNLGEHASKPELEEVFSRYGRVENVWVARNPPGFAFVEFHNENDAEDAVRALDGSRMCGERATVEMSTGKSRGGSLGRGGPRGSGAPFRGGRGGGRERFPAGEYSQREAARASYPTTRSLERSVEPAEAQAIPAHGTRKERELLEQQSSRAAFPEDSRSSRSLHRSTSRSSSGHHDTRSGDNGFSRSRSGGSDRSRSRDRSKSGSSSHHRGERRPPHDSSYHRDHHHHRR